MDGLDLTRAVKSILRHQSDDIDQIWDAIMYRTNVVRSQLTSQELSHLLAGFAKSSRTSRQFVDLLTIEMIPKVSSLGIDSAGLCLHACTKLHVQSSKIRDLADSVCSTLLNKIADNSRDKDISLVLYSLRKLDVSNIEAFKTKVVACLSRRLDKIDCGRTLSTLAYCFCPAPPSMQPTPAAHFDDEPFEDPATCTGTITHIDFLKALLEQLSKRLPQLNSADLVLLINGIGNLRLVHDDKSIIPAYLMRQLSHRMSTESASFPLHDMVSLFGVASPFLFPDLSNRPLILELVYRVRDLSVKQCLTLLCNLYNFKEAMQTADVTKLQSAVFYRLMLPETRMDAEQVALLAAYGKASLVGRDAMLSALVSLQKLGPGQRLADLLAVYAEAGVRDSHWLHICSHPDLEIGNPSIPVYLAQLSLPDCAEKLRIFEKFPVTQSLVYAGAVFELLERRPKSLDFEKLSTDFACNTGDPDMHILIQAARGDYSAVLDYKSGRTVAPFEERVSECINSWSEVMVYRNSHRLAVHLPSMASWMVDTPTTPSSSVQATELSQESFVLIECLVGDRDYYHESEHIQSKSMRERKHTLRAEREAEIAALRRSGWVVLQISEKQCGTDLQEFILSQFLSLS